MRELITVCNSSNVFSDKSDIKGCSMVNYYQVVVSIFFQISDPT